MNRRAQRICLRPHGVSLVEILLALVIGLVVIGAVARVFLASRASYAMQTELARLQEGVRVAQQVLVDDIRGAGHLGCLGYGDRSNLVSNLSPHSADLQLDDFRPELGVQGWEADASGPGQVVQLATGAPTGSASGHWQSGTGDEPGGLSSMRGSDILRIWRVGNVVALTEAPASDNVVSVTVQRDNDFQRDDLVLLTDCSAGYWVRACNVQNVGSGGDAATRLSFPSSCGNLPPGQAGRRLRWPAEAGKPVSHIYYIGKLGGASTATPTLYRRTLNTSTGAMTHGQPLIEGVESMQVLYGMDSTGNRAVDAYLPADQVADWRQVVSVRIALLFAGDATDADSASGDGSFDLLGTTIQVPNDGRPRYVSTMTIALRNRAL